MRYLALLVLIATILTSPDDQGSTPRLKRYLGGY